MKCKKCSEKAVIKLKAHHISLCKLDYLEFFERRVTEAIKRYKLFSFQEKILVAVSGGKDSLNSWWILRKLGYQADALYLDLGIEGYSEKSKEKVVQFGQKIKGSLKTVKVEEEIGTTIPQAARKGERTPCALCGLVKRYLMNREAIENSYSAIVTGHNLDDEIAVLLSNVLNWQIGYLGRQSPLLPAWHPKLAKKAKPLCEVTERESAAYALLNGIDYIMEECPYSKGATSLFYKNILNQIEQRSPGTKLRFYRKFLSKGKLLFESRPAEELVECTECGLPTTYPPCAFCRLKKRLSSS